MSVSFAMTFYHKKKTKENADTGCPLLQSPLVTILTNVEAKKIVVLQMPEDRDDYVEVEWMPEDCGGLGSGSE